MTNHDLSPSPTPGSRQLVDPSYLNHLTAALRAAGQAANKVGSHHVFVNFRQRKAANTLRRHDADLRGFEVFLNEVLSKTGLVIPDNALRQDPKFWQGITWGLVEAFVYRRLKQGYAISTVNFQLSTIKCYAELAAQAGELPALEMPLIKAVKAIRSTEGVRLDEKRAVNRVGHKKAEPTRLNDALAEALIDQRTDTAQGLRDGLMMCLLLHHGLRASEIVRLRAEDFDLEHGLLRFYRPKVTKTQTHQLTKETLAAARRFIYSGKAPTSGPLFSEATKSGALEAAHLGVPLTTRGLNDRVRHLGMVIGIDTLSPHDCRHYWATRAAENKVPLERLKQAGGWNTVLMPIRYITDSAIANEGMTPDKDEAGPGAGKQRKPDQAGPG